GTGDLQQRGLPGPVRTEHHPPLSLGDPPGHAVEEGVPIPDDGHPDEVEHVTHAEDPRAMPSRVRTPTLDIVLELPRSVRLATWGTALLTGGVPMSAAVAAVSGDDEPHDVRTARPLEADLQAAPGALSTSDLAGLLE